MMRVAVRCSVLQCVAVCCSVLQCVRVCYSVLQYVAVCCSVLQRVESYRMCASAKANTWYSSQHSCTLQHVAVPLTLLTTRIMRLMHMPLELSHTFVFHVFEVVFCLHVRFLQVSRSFIGLGRICLWYIGLLFCINVCDTLERSQH